MYLKKAYDELTMKKQVYEWHKHSHDEHVGVNVYSMCLSIVANDKIVDHVQSILEVTEINLFT